MRSCPCLPRGNLTKSPSALRSLGLAIHASLPGDGTWRTATERRLAQLHKTRQPQTSPPSCGLRISQRGTCNAGLRRPMGARRPLPPLGHKPSFKQISEFPISASVIPFDHQHTSPLSDSPTVKPSPSRCRYVQSRLQKLEFLYLSSIPSPLRPARRGVACGAMGGGCDGSRRAMHRFPGRSA